MKSKSIKNLFLLSFEKAKGTNKLFLILLAAFVLIIPAGCKDDNPDDPPPPEEPIQYPREIDFITVLKSRNYRLII